jgi:hypothetical protein
VETVEVELASYANTYLDGIEVSVPIAPSRAGAVGSLVGTQMALLTLPKRVGGNHSSSSRCQGEPFVTEQELERFIFDSIPHIPLVMEANLHESFLPFYVFAAVRRLLFFLDPLRTRRVNIRKLSHSQEMDEFLWLQRLDQYRDDYEDEASFQKQVRNFRDESLATCPPTATYPLLSKMLLSQVASNWFSAENSMRLYDIYVSLDKDGNGMLNQVWRGVASYVVRSVA